MKAALFFVAWLVGITAVIWAGTLPNLYMQFVRGIPPPHPYPYSGVIWVVAFISAEAALVYAAIRPHTFSCSWGRAGIALLVAATFFVFGLASAMHAPPYITVYLWWLLAVLGALLLLFLFSVVRRLVRGAQPTLQADGPASGGSAA